MSNKKKSQNLQRSSLPAPKPAASQTLPAVAPVVVPTVAYRGGSRTAPAAVPALAPSTAFRGVCRAPPAIFPRAAPPPSSRGRVQDTAAKDNTALAPRAAPMATSTITETPAPTSHNEDEWYKVSTPEFDTVAFDPLDPPKRYHTGVFIETDSGASKGALFHVTGDVIAKNGMRFEVRANYVPSATKYFHKTTVIGWIRKADYTRIRGILEALPKPTKQQGLDFWSKDRLRRNKITWTKENGELYGPGEERRPIMKCNEWTHELAIPKLRQEGILIDSI